MLNRTFAILVLATLSLFATTNVFAQENAGSVVHENDMVYTVDISDISKSDVKAIASIRYVDIIMSTNDKMIVKSTADASGRAKSSLLEIVSKSALKEEKGSSFNSAK